MRSEETLFRFAVFNKIGGPLSKTISLSDSGQPVSDATNCKMSMGKARNVSVTGLNGLGELIEALESEQAISLGSILAADDDRIFDVVVKDAPRGAPDQIARTKEFIGFVEGQPGLLLIDFDQKGMPDDVRGRIQDAGGVWNLICQTLPDFAAAGNLRRASTSAGLSNAKTGKVFDGSGGEHIYVAVRDASDIPRATKVLHQRLWLAGLGWMRLGAIGQLLERSIVDQSVGSPERLVFEGPPILVPPLEQSTKARRPVVAEGLVIDTRTAIPNLTPSERARYQHMLDEQRSMLKPKADVIRERADDRLSRELADRTGVELSVASAQIARRHRGDLLPLIPLQFDDLALGEVTVDDVLRDPNRFVDQTLADPLEGISYGRNKAKLFRRPDGSLWINSFAHGGGRYELRHDGPSLRALIATLQRSEDAEAFVTALAGAAVDPSAESPLLHAAKRACGVSVGDLRSLLGSARQAIAERARRIHQPEHYEDGRVQLPPPGETAELTPTLVRVDMALVAVDADTPPFRTLDHRLARVSQRSISNLHQLVSEGDDSLPAPAQATIKVADDAEAAMILEENVRFVSGGDGDGDGDHTPVRLQLPFLRAYTAWEGSHLPRVSGIATLPLVLPNRTLKSGQSLDRDLGLVFDVPGELEDALVNVDGVTLDEAEEAYKWLCDGWLCDVETDSKGKAVIIALALTVIERHLLPERPAFFVAAAQRGTGKTTVLNMVSTAITGAMASAASWSFDDEERRKGVFSYLREGAPLVAYDNIPRGSAIGCPTIERALTSTELRDRVLGESRSETVPTATVIAFTGNNISPKGDMASRSLVAHLATDRPDPENRDFTHEDPIFWTRSHRVEILRRLFMLLMLDRAKPNRSKTRFKRWWSLIGYPIELVADVDFEDMFRANDQFDEEAQGAADFMAMMVKVLGGLGGDAMEFMASDVFKLIEESWAVCGKVFTGSKPDKDELKSALEEASGRPFTGGSVTSHRVARKLRSIEGRPVMVDGVMVKLVVIKDHEGNRYRIERG